MGIVDPNFDFGTHATAAVGGEIYVFDPMFAREAITLDQWKVRIRIENNESGNIILGVPFRVSFQSLNHGTLGD